MSVECGMWGVCGGVCGLTHLLPAGTLNCIIDQRDDVCRIVCLTSQWCYVSFLVDVVKVSSVIHPLRATEDALEPVRSQQRRGGGYAAFSRASITLLDGEMRKEQV